MKNRTRLLLFVLLAVPTLLAAFYFLLPGVVLTLAQRAELRGAGLEQHGIDAAGLHIEYLSGGRGDAIVLLHGFSADKSNWVRVAKYLTPHLRVIAPDLPGFGDSTRDPNARYAISDQVERVHAFAQALRLDSFHLGGNSMGGTIAGAYAARYPHEVKTLWLLAPGGVRSAEPSELQELMARGENPLFIRDADGFERLLDFVFVERPYIPRPIARYLAEQGVRNRPFNEKISADLNGDPLALEATVKGLSVPALIVWGARDRLVHVSGARILGSVMPDAKVVVMPNVGHIPMVERPAETAAELLRFLGIAAGTARGA